MATTTREQITNPYSQENRAKYNMGGFEQFFHDLGFRTGYDNYHMDMDNKAAEWETQNQSLSYEENYNSEAAQTARMRAAGLNPDLQGLGDAAQASEMNEPELPPTSGTDEMSIAGNAAAKIGTFMLDTLMGSVSMIKTLGDTSIGIGEYLQGKDKRETENKGNLLKLVQEAHNAYGNLSGKDYGFIGGTKAGKMMGLSKRNLGKFAEMYDALYSSVPEITKKTQEKTEAFNAQTKFDLVDEVREIEKFTNAAALSHAETEAKKAELLAESVKKHPEFTEEEFKAGHAKTMDEAKAAKFDAAYKEYNAKVAELDKLQSESDQNIINEWLSGRTKWSPKSYMKYRNALRRRFGTDDILGEFGEDALKVGIGVAGGAAAAKIGGKAVAKGARIIPNVRNENTPRYSDWQTLNDTGVDLWDYNNPYR